MRVHNENAPGSAAAGTGCTQEVQKSAQGNASRTSGTDSSGDHVEFSSSLGKLSQIISTDSIQRNSRVQSVAAAYQAGTYRPDPMAVSRAMITDATGSM
jgi:anti-sigma28 factor (negative regulator of flagellin synthesis)